MASPALTSWALPRLSQLLPLDEESLTQVITYTASLSKEEAAEHLGNLLGDSPAAIEFISSFSSRIGNTGTTSSSANGKGNRQRDSRGPDKKGKKQKAPLHSAGPPRRPDNYGNVAGGYVKAVQDDYYMPGSSSRTPSGRQRDGQKQAANSPLLDTLAAPEDPAALQLPRSRGSTSPYTSSAAASRNASPASRPPSTKPPPSASGPMISDYLPNVKSKAAKASRRGGGSGTATPSKQTITTTTGNIADLTAAIAALEVSTNPGLGKDGQKCNCNASLHPLFTPAPNCLNCGKIICSLEGLQPCSFCGTPLLSNTEMQDMIRELRAERGNEKMRAHNDSVRHDGAPGSSAPQTKDVDSTLNAAKAHRDKLLAFQAQNAKRTRVVDEAADFDTPNVASTQWMSPAQRALALKKQQRILREMEDLSRPEWEKKKTIMSLDIKGGKVVRTYQAAPVEKTEVEENAEERELLESGASASSGHERGGAFGKNPLLSGGGLIRPIWKAPDVKGKETDGGQERKKKQTWRKVQDDQDNNEQWVLDGGVHGYDTETNP